MGVGWGLRVEVEVLDDERTFTLAVVKDLGRCLTLPAAALCCLVVVIGVGVVWCSTASPVTAVLAARVFG